MSESTETDCDGLALAPLRVGKLDAASVLAPWDEDSKVLVSDCDVD